MWKGAHRHMHIHVRAYDGKSETEKRLRGRARFEGYTVCLPSGARFALVTETLYPTRTRSLVQTFAEGVPSGDGGFSRRAFPNLDGVNSRTCLKGCFKIVLHPAFHLLPFPLSLSLSLSLSLPLSFLSLLSPRPPILVRLCLLLAGQLCMSSFSSFPVVLLIFSFTWNLVRSIPFFYTKFRTTQSPCAALRILHALSPVSVSVSLSLSLLSLQHRLSYGDNMLISHSRC